MTKQYEFELRAYAAGASGRSRKRNAQNAAVNLHDAAERLFEVSVRAKHGGKTAALLHSARVRVECALLQMAEAL